MESIMATIEPDGPGHYRANGNYLMAPHPAVDHDKVRSMADVLRAGGALPPVVVYGGEDESLAGAAAAEGSHRLAAAALVPDAQLELQRVEDDEYAEIAEDLGHPDEMTDGDELEEFCAAARRRAT